MKIFAKQVKITKRSWCEICSREFPKDTEMYWSPRMKKVRCKECVDRGKEIVKSYTSEERVDTSSRDKEGLSDSDQEK